MAELARLIVDFFLNRQDRLANLAPWRAPCPIEVAGDLDKIIAAHLGKMPHEAKHLPSNRAPKREPVERVGSYTPDRDGLTRWVCFDFDGKGHAAALSDPLATAERVIEALKSEGFPGHLERSGGGQGFHVWIFFDAPIEAAAARKLAFSVVPKDAPLTSGEAASAEKNTGIEIFPKTDRPVGDGLGNMVWLPWWAGAPEDCGEFYQRDDRGEWRSYRPTDFARASSALAAVTADKLRRAEVPAAPAKPPRPEPKSEAWAEFRARIIREIDLTLVYGDLLVGKRDGKGFMSCRDPESPSGDQHPSASVADGSGQAQRGSFHSMRTGEHLSLFDFVMRRRGLDMMGACKYLGELSGVPLPKPDKKEPKRTETDDRPLEVIVNGRQLTEVVREAWGAMLRCTTPRVYVRGGELVRIVNGSESARIAPMTSDATRGALIRSAKWLRVKNNSDGIFYLDDKPPRELPGDLMTYPHPSLPRLDAVVQSPCFVVGGRLVSAPGYDDESGLYYDQRDTIAAIPEKPDTDDVAAAKMLIEDDLLVDFPFASLADRAAAWALLLLPFVRRMISGPTPLHLIEAPQAGSGKGLIADLVSIVFTGKPADVSTLPEDEEETRKKITTVLRKAKPIVTLDNLPFGSKSANLAASITAHVWSDRVLGKLEDIELENRAVWITTCNNPDFNVDLARRCVRIRIDPGEERPWERSAFRHPNLREWATEKRSDLVSALLVVVRYWVRQGMPRGERSLGSFERWAQVIGGILESVGVRDFLANSADLYAQADSDSAEWIEFVRFWWAKFDRAEVTTHQLVGLADDERLLQSVRGDRGPQSQRIRVGKSLTRMRGRVIDGRRILMGLSEATRSRVYALEPVTDEAAAPISIESSPGRVSG